MAARSSKAGNRNPSSGGATIWPGAQLRLLSALRESELKSGEIREEFYRKVIDSLDMGDSNYVILLAYDAYDVPTRSRDGEATSF